MFVLAVCHMVSVSMPKYAWMSLSLMPAISFQGTLQYFVLSDSGSCFDASPTISMLRMTAFIVFFVFDELRIG